MKSRRSKKTSPEGDSLLLPYHGCLLSYTVGPRMASMGQAHRTCLEWRGGALHRRGILNRCEKQWGRGNKRGRSSCAMSGRKAKIVVETELQDAAEAFIDLFGESELAKELLVQFRATEVAKHHRTIASVPWRRVYSTNYDTVFELASSPSIGNSLPDCARNVRSPLTTRGPAAAARWFSDHLTGDCLWKPLGRSGPDN